MCVLAYVGVCICMCEGNERMCSIWIYDNMTHQVFHQCHLINPHDIKMHFVCLHVCERKSNLQLTRWTFYVYM